MPTLTSQLHQTWYHFFSGVSVVQHFNVLYFYKMQTQHQVYKTNADWRDNTYMVKFNYVTLCRSQKNVKFMKCEVISLLKCVKKRMVKAFKLSERYPVLSSGVADRAKGSESILICVIAAWSCERHFHLVLANCFSGNNVFLSQKRIGTNDEWIVQNKFMCCVFPKCFPWWHFIHQREIVWQLLDQFSDASTVVFILL